MAAGTVYASKVTNFRASPQVMNRPQSAGGVKRIWTDTIEAASTSFDDVGDVIVMAVLPSNASIKQITLWNDDLDTGGTAMAVDIGVYDKSVAVKDADAYASAITTLTGANVTSAGTKVRFESAATDIAKINQMIWEDAGYTTDPGGYLYIAMTVTTAATTFAAGTISWEIEYVTA